jgi:hypothetical protein
MILGREAQIQGGAAVFATKNASSAAKWGGSLLGESRLAIGDSATGP